MKFVCAFLSSCAGWWGPEVGLDFPVFGRCLVRSTGAEEGRDEGVLLRDGSGNEGEGGTVAVREGRSTRREVARQPEDRLKSNTVAGEIWISMTFGADMI